MPISAITAYLATLLEIFPIRLVEPNLPPRFHQIVVVLLLLRAITSYIGRNGGQDIMTALEIISFLLGDALFLLL